MAALTKTVKLKRPFTIGETEYSELTFKRPKARHLRGLPLDPDMGDILDFSAKLCGEAPHVIDELDAEDVMEVAAVVADFLPTGLPTGSN